MRSRLKQGFAAAALACCVVLIASMPPDAYAQNTTLPEDTYASRIITIGKKQYTAYRLLFSARNPFVGGKVAGILLLQQPDLNWQAFVTRHDGGCYQLGATGGASVAKLQADLQRLQPLAGSWRLPDKISAFSSILVPINAEFGALHEARNDLPDGLPPTAGNVEALAKVVLGCTSPTVITAEGLKAALSGESPEQDATTGEADDELAEDSAKDKANAANKADEEAEAAAELPAQQAQIVQDAPKRLSGEDPAAAAHSAAIEAQPREHQKALAAKDAEIKQLQATVAANQSKIVQLEGELSALRSSSGAGSRDQERIRDLRQRLEEAEQRVKRAEHTAQRLETDSGRNWADLVSFAETRLPNELDRAYRLQQWIQDRKPQANAFGPIERVAPTEQPSLFNADGLINLILGTFLLLLIVLIGLVLYQVRRQGMLLARIPVLVASTLREQMLFGPTNPKGSIWDPKSLLAAIQSLYRGTVSWGDAVSQHRQELFADPIARARHRLETFSAYRPRPIAAEGNTFDTPERLQVGKAAASTIRRPADQPADGQRRQPPICEIAQQWAGAVEQQVSDFNQALSAAEKARGGETGEAVALTPASLPQAAEWMQANQATALPLGQLFRVVTNAQSTLLRRAHEELTRRDEALEGLLARITETRNALAETRNRAEQFQRFTTRRLLETGFISSAVRDAPDALTEAMERFDDDIRHFPERLDYASRLISLRDYLEDPRSQDLPYFRAAGLDDLRVSLGKRDGDWQSLFRKDDEQKSVKKLLAQWGHFLQYLYRSRLLLRTYWGKGVDRDMWLRLDRAHAVVRTVLEQYEIRPHRIELLKPLNEVQQPQRIIADDTKALPVALAQSRELTEMFEQLPYPDNEKVVVDIASWGVDCEVSGAGQLSQTLLITRSKRGGLTTASTS